jgi:hypothetical protein
MQEVDQVSSLIRDIYDAAVDPVLWGDLLGDARDFVGGSAAVLYTKDMTRKSANICYDDGGIDPHYKQLYLDQYVKFDPTSTAEFFVAIEQPTATADLVRYDEFLQTRYYHEWARPQGLVDHLRAALEKSAASIVFFGVFRDQRDGVVDDEMRQRMRLIVPHIRRAVLIGQLIDRKTAEAAAFADTLDGVSAGLFLVDAGGRMVHANASGQAMLDERCVLRAGGDKVAATEAEADRSARRRPGRRRAARAARSASAGRAGPLGIGEATVKTHLHHVFGKTGTSRQADLVKLVAGFSKPARQLIDGLGKRHDGWGPTSTD